ncbi:hypothetical protein PVL29_025756 [Vitis rotundifolia]|uniref:Uncharacterized protein n=1 Tax=Vitis rotundifolia TaxID=103349 RepID=A0AA39D6A4_VITRO|nr:hypothetical protein PVL29_025756 [Vitis rotundifolia]
MQHGEAADYHNAPASTIDDDERVKVVDGVSAGGDKAVKEYLSSIKTIVEVNDHMEFGIGGRLDVVLRMVAVGFLEGITTSY